MTKSFQKGLQFQVASLVSVEVLARYFHEEIFNELADGHQPRY